MKKLWSKNTIIGLLVLTNLCSVMFILEKEYKLANLVQLFSKPIQKEVAPAKASSLERKMQNYRKVVLRPATQKHQSDLETCYQELINREPVVDEGAVLVQWMITSEGQVEDLGIESSEIDDESFQSCIIEQLSQMRFSPPPDPMGAFVAHKFRFKRVDPKTMGF